MIATKPSQIQLELILEIFHYHRHLSNISLQGYEAWLKIKKLHKLDQEALMASCQHKTCQLLLNSLAEGK